MLYVSFVSADEIIFEITGKAEINGFTFNDNSSYKLYKSNGITGFNVYCKNISQNDDYIIMKIFRGSEYQESGAGQAKIIEASKNYAYLVGSECSHAITYLKTSDYFAIQKCKF